MSREQIIFIILIGNLASTAIMTIGWWNEWRNHTQIYGTIGSAFFLGMWTAMWLIKH